MRVRHWLWLLWLLAAPTLAQEAGVRAWLERDSVYEGESVVLTIEIDDQAEGAVLDTTPLLRDFRVLTRQTGSFLRQVDGRMTAKTQWLMHLEPRRGGELTVPALSIGPHRTQPLTLRVEPAPSADATDQTQAQDIMLEVEAEPRAPYVQSQVRLTVRLLLGAPLLRGGLEEPEHPDATVEKLGNDREYRSTRQGRDYQIIERRYALFPEKSGELVLPALRFQGQVGLRDPGQPGPNRYLNRSRQAQAASAPLTLRVRPRPADYKGEHWLPAAELSLREAWPEEPPRFRVGEPITRKLIVEARGLRAAQLPELTAPAGDQFRVYPEQPLADNRVEGEWVSGRRELAMALVPTAAGRFLLPELRLVWWDTVTDQERVAVLPEREITVAEAAGGLPSPPPAIAPRPAPLAPAVEPSPPGSGPGPDLWPWAAGALGLLWLLTLGLWWRERRRRPAPAPVAEPPRAAAARRVLAKACRNHDPQRAAAELLDWAAAAWPGPPPRNLGELAGRLAAGGEAVRALDRALYAPGGGGWRGEALWAAVKGGLRTRTASVPATPPGPLPPLYSPRPRSIR